MKTHPVIAVSGISGSGKTTLAQAIAGKLQAQLVAYDAYETMTRRPAHDIRDWIARGCSYAEIRCPGLVAALEAARAKGPVVFDTPLGRAHPEMRAMIDFSLWLECPEKQALVRKLSQMRHPQGGAAPVPAAWINSYLELYPDLVQPAQKVQCERVRPLADLSLPADGSLTTDQMLRSFLLVLKRQISRDI